MNPDSEKDLQQTLHDAAQPAWLTDDAALEAALDDAAKTATPISAETATRIASEAVRPAQNVIPVQTKPRRAFDVFWKIAAALALLGAGFGTAWMMRAPTRHDVASIPGQQSETLPANGTTKPDAFPNHSVITPQVWKPTEAPRYKYTPPASVASAVNSSKPSLLVSTSSHEAAAPAQDKVLATKKHERSVHRLADDSLLWLDEETRVSIVSDREVKLEAGRAYVEVARRMDAAGHRVPFVMQTPRGPVTALGTKFAVNVSGAANEILVTEGKVTAPGLQEAIVAGQWWHGAEIEAAPQAAFGLGWTRDLRALISPPPVPVSADAGGALRSADGADAFALRRCHVDVYIEDGIARTTIDQTYFNHLPRRLEGTFFFPLPPDASISRLAMYVNGKLMEGGMAEREEARRTFESIKHKMQDPALLEWVDGSTFKMRVFPLEGREEKRIIISYTQRLDTLNGRSSLRVPVGHSLGKIGEWNFETRVKNGRDAIWRSASHDLKPNVEGDDLVLHTELKNTKVERDVQLEIATAPSTAPRFNTFEHEGWRYLALRWTPTLPPSPALMKRHWAFLVETSADRDEVLARTQREVLKSILSIASADDTFSVVTAGTRAQSLVRSLPVNAANRDAVLAEMEKQSSLGALDLGAAFHALGALDAGSVIVHLGSATPVLGELENTKLLDLLPRDSIYAGIGVGKRWNIAFARAAASRTGGWFTRINPDEAPGWRAFEFVSAINAARLTDIRLDSPTGSGMWLLMNETLAQGGELCALSRVPAGARLPEKVEVHGMIAGKEWKQSLTLEKSVEAGWLPRAWAKLEIDRLVNDGAEKHRADIVSLSKASCVMSPFTSLLVLENDAMYAQYKVDRGRKDHWAMYPCPDTIPVVREPLDGSKPVNETLPAQRTQQEIIDIATKAIQSLDFEYGPGFQYAPGLAGNGDALGNPAMVLDSGSIIDLNGFIDTVGSLGNSSSLGRVAFWNEGAIGTGALGLVPDSINGVIGGWATVNGTDWAAQPGAIRLLGNNTYTGGTTISGGTLVFNGGNFAYTGSGATLDVSGTAGVIFGTGSSNTNAIFSGVITSNISGATDFAKVGNGTLTFGRTSGFTGDLTLGGTLVKSGGGSWVLSGANSYSGNTTINAGTLTLSSGGILPLNNITRSAGAPLFLTGGSWGDNTLAFPGLRAVSDNSFAGYITSPAANVNTSRGPSMAQLGDLMLHSGVMPQPPRYSTQSGIMQDEIFLRDLTIYAAGFTTTNMDRSSAAEEALDLKAGAIADDARALVEKCRHRSAVHHLGTKREDDVLAADGRFLHDERNIWGLREIVSMDGGTLRHLYPELGLGTERKMTATRWRELMELFPWIVAPVEVLALDADVHCPDSLTIEIKPHREEALVTRIKFLSDGRIHERMLLNRENAILSRLTINWNGSEVTAHVRDKNGHEILSHRWTLTRSTEYELLPPAKLDDLVILPMPAKRWNNSGQQSPMERISTEWLNNRTALLSSAVHDHLDKGDTRPGWFVLGLSGKLSDVREETRKIFERTAEKQKSAIACYVLAQSHRTSNNAQKPDAYGVPRSENAFIDHLMSFREAWLWANDSSSQNELQRAQRLSTAMKLGDLVEAPGLALTGLRKSYAMTNDATLLTRMAELIGKVKQKRKDWRLSAVEAEAWLVASDATKAAKLFEEWFEESVKQDQVSAPGAAFHRAFFASGERERYTALVKRGVEHLVARNRRIEALQFAGHGVADAPDAKELVTQAADYVPSIFQSWPNDEAQAAGSLVAAQALGNAQRHAAALEYTRNAMNFLNNRKDAAQLHVAALAQFIQRKIVVMALQKSLGQQPNENDERELADAAAKILAHSTEQPAIAARLIASWLEPVLRDLAHEYRTSPLALAPNQSQPWMDYAGDCAAVDHRPDVDYAMDRAFAAEQTNADILLRHALYLDATQRAGEARKFYQQIVSGTWGPNYQNAIWQAKQKLGVK